MKPKQTLATTAQTGVTFSHVVSRWYPRFFRFTYTCKFCARGLATSVARLITQHRQHWTMSY